MRGSGWLAVIAIGGAVPAAAQLPAQAPIRIVADTVPHAARPLNYFARSLLIPGWGQASLGRKLTAGLFIGFEGLALGMTLKASSELHYVEQIDSAKTVTKRAERQDWIVLLAFNHLLSGLEAYVSAQLRGFPPDLRLQVLPGRRPGIGVTVGLPH
ncbi:MAG: hypothetical protein ACREL5_10335 [Gemmatimonadales bacterium]